MPVSSAVSDVGDDITVNDESVIAAPQRQSLAETETVLASLSAARIPSFKIDTSVRTTSFPMARFVCQFLNREIAERFFCPF